MPRPLSPEYEAGIEIRRSLYNKTVQEFIGGHCDENGEQESNLTEKERMGLKRLRKRIMSGELLVLKTDKSGKFALISREKLKEIGEEHTAGDRKIERKEVNEREKVLNGHSTMWCKMTNAGQDFDHDDRIITSKTTKSNNLSSLYFLIKDHKATLAVRPVVTGCSGNSLGLSNSVSDLLEAVANSVIDAYEVISSEDLLAEVHECNRKVTEKIKAKMQRGEEIDWEKELIMFGSDVVALFPSLTSENTGRIVRRQIQKSSMKFKGMDFKQIILYVMLNRHL